jgi:hypothetical protein
VNVADFLLFLLNTVVYFPSPSLLFAYTLNSSRVFVSKFLPTAIEKTSVGRFANPRLINLKGDNDALITPVTAAAGSRFHIIYCHIAKEVFK